jgi:hypothetical protein
LKPALGVYWPGKALSVPEKGGVMTVTVGFAPAPVQSGARATGALGAVTTVCGVHCGGSRLCGVANAARTAARAIIAGAFLDWVDGVRPR